MFETTQPNPLKSEKNSASNPLDLDALNPWSSLGLNSHRILWRSMTKVEQQTLCRCSLPPISSIKLVGPN